MFAVVLSFWLLDTDAQPLWGPAFLYARVNPVPVSTGDHSEGSRPSNNLQASVRDDVSSSQYFNSFKRDTMAFIGFNVWDGFLSASVGLFQYVLSERGFDKILIRIGAYMDR